VAIYAFKRFRVIRTIAWFLCGKLVHLLPASLRVKWSWTSKYFVKDILEHRILDRMARSVGLRVCNSGLLQSCVKERKQARTLFAPPKKKKKKLQYKISMLNIGQAARRPEGPSVPAAFINLIINNLYYNKCKKKENKKKTKQNNPKLKERNDR